jgi:dTMP kinase
VGALVRQALAGRVVGAARGALDPAALALLFAADRLDHLASEVEPSLARGVDVVADRYTLSSLAYQSVAVGDAGWVEAINRRATAPDVTIFLEVRPAVALRRRLATSSRPELFEVPAFQRRVALAYRRALSRLRSLGQRVEVLEGEGSIEAVAAAVSAAVERLG